MLPLLIPAIKYGGPLAASFLGGLFKDKSKQTTTSSLSPEASAFNTNLLKMFQDRLGSSADLSGYKSQGMQDINHAFDVGGQSLENKLSASGLLRSPVAGTAFGTANNARLGELSRFGNSIPLLQREQQGQDLSMASQFLGMQPRTTTTTGSAGGGLGGGLGDLGGMLGYMLASGAFGGAKKPGVGLPNLYQGF